MNAANPAHLVIPSIGIRLAVALALASARCAIAGEEPPLVYVGLPPQRWLVQQLAGNRVRVGVLLQAGQNPHTFEPTASQVRDLSRADLYLMAGLPFERVVVGRVRALRPGLQVRDVTEGFPRRRMEAHGHAGHGHSPESEEAESDPHVWLCCAGMAALATNTAAALASCDPLHQAAYAAQLVQVTARIAALDRELQGELAPLRGRVLLTYHPSWGYFADAYGLRQVVFEAEGKAPSARQLAELIARARSEHVRCVFTEPVYDPRPAETLARQIGARVETIDPLAENWDDLLRRFAAALDAATTR